MRRFWALLLAVGCGGPAAPSGEDRLARLGLPMYPGATVVKGERDEAMRQDEQGNDRVRVTLRSADPPPKVAEFYARELKTKPTSSGKGFQFGTQTPKGVFLLMGVEAEGSGSLVTASGIAPR